MSMHGCMQMLKTYGEWAQVLKTRVGILSLHVFSSCNPLSACVPSPPWKEMQVALLPGVQGRHAYMQMPMAESGTEPLELRYAGCADSEAATPFGYTCCNVSAKLGAHTRNAGKCN